MRTELHCHTSASDGALTPQAVVALARDRAVAVLAITDHDTIAANDTAIEAGQALGVRVIAGIEISALSDEGKEVHVLGYGMCPRDAATRDKLLSLRDVREARAKAILSKLESLGIPISFARVKELAGDAMIGRPHVARALLERGVVKTMNEAFDLYIAEGQPAFVPHEGLTPQQAIALIHAAQGAAVLAHPMLYHGDLDQLLTNMVAAGLDGIEAYYPAHTPEDVHRLTALARSANLLSTGGSDFHGIYGDHEVLLGAIALPQPEALISALDARIEQYQHV
jgi:hypothetical protein